MHLLDILFPKHCVRCKKFGEYICSNCFALISFETFPKCLVCGYSSIGGFTHPKCKGRFTIDGVSCAVLYKGIIKKIVYQLKYQPYLADLKKSLGDLMEESFNQNQAFMTYIKSNPVVIPIPLSWAKYKKRGYNQAEILAKEIAKRFSLERENLLERIKETKPQYGLSKEERKKNLQEAFRLPFGFKHKHLEFKNALLVDDILTTGSTILEASKVLKKNGFEKVWAVAFAQD